MITYIRVVNGEVIPYSLKQLYKDNPNVSFPDPISYGTLSEFSVYPVVSTNKPTDTIQYKYVEGTPVYEDNQYVQVWDQVQRSPEEISAELQLLKKQIVGYAQEQLDLFAQTKNYDSIMSACTYSNSTVETFKQEALRCIQLRDNTWNALYQYLADVESGVTPLPSSVDDVIPYLPELSW